MAIRAVLLDLDGTVYALEQPLAAADLAITALRHQGLRLRFTTNIDSRPPQAVLAQVRGFGVDIRDDEIFTPATAALRLFDTEPTPRVYPLVSAALLPTFGHLDSGPPYDYVLVGDCRDRLGYKLFDGAFRALRDGAQLIALQRGRYFKRADGDHVDAGALVAGLEYAAAVSARVLGKPEPDFFGLALASMQGSAAEALVVGDDVTSDIAGGHRLGAGTVLVRTGKFWDNALRTDVVAADHVIDSVADLPELIESMAGR